MKQITVYEFNELDEKGKEEALSILRTININSEYWYDGIYLDFIDEAAKKGLNIKYNNIDFSGFDCQGDGASFTTDDIDTRKIIEVLNINFKNDYLKNLFIDWFDTFKIVRTNSLYCHCNTVCVHWENDFDYYNGGSYKRLSDYFTKKAIEIENKLERLKDELCNKLYNDLENEYEYLISDEAVSESIIENEYYFFKNGKLV